MKLVIEHEPYQRMITDQPMEWAVYLDGPLEYMFHPPLMRFSSESEARRYCELRQQAKQIAEYEL